MAVHGTLTVPRPALVNLSVRVTSEQGYWLDSMARRMGQNTGECLRVLLDEWMAREQAVHNRTQPAPKPCASGKVR